MFIPDVCIQIAGITKPGCDVLLIKLALWLVDVFGFPSVSALKAKYRQTGDLVFFFSTRPLVISLADLAS